MMNVAESQEYDSTEEKAIKITNQISYSSMDK